MTENYDGFGGSGIFFAFLIFALFAFGGNGGGWGWGGQKVNRSKENLTWIRKGLGRRISKCNSDTQP